MFLPFTDRNDVPVHIRPEVIISLQPARKWATDEFGNGSWEIDDTHTILTYGSGEDSCVIVKASIATVLAMLAEPDSI